jgi:hypothetical protein
MRTSLTLLAAAMTLTSSAALASVLVVKSLGPSSKLYPPGKALAEGTKLNLQGGDVVTIIGPSSARTFRGPGSFDSTQVTLASAAGQRGRFGALRSTDITRSPSIWDIDVSQSGRICVAESKMFQLWRPQSDGSATVQIRSADGKTQNLSWAAGKALTSWPTALPVKSGAQYQVEWPDSGDKSKLEIVTVKEPPKDLQGAAQVLIENGCQNQLDLLVAGASKN